MSTAEHKRELLSAALLMLEQPDWKRVDVHGERLTRLQLTAAIRLALAGGVENDKERQTRLSLQALIDACAPYLKEGETPAECILRNRADSSAVLKLLAHARNYTQGPIELVNRTRSTRELESMTLAEQFTYDPYDGFKPGRDIA